MSRRLRLNAGAGAKYPVTNWARYTTTSAPSDWVSTAVNDAARSPRQSLFPIFGEDVCDVKPYFIWPHFQVVGTRTGDNSTYTVQFRQVGTTIVVSTQTTAVQTNHMLSSFAFTRGLTYEWRVISSFVGNPLNDADTNWSGWRAFRVMATAGDLNIPANMAAACIARPYPRLAQSSASLALYRVGGPLRAKTIQKIADFGTAGGAGFEGDALIYETTLTASTSRDECGTILTCIFLWEVEGLEKYRTEGVRRLIGLITPLSGSVGYTVGSTGKACFAADDQTPRWFVSALAYAFDAFRDQLTGTQLTQFYTMAGAILDRWDVLACNTTSPQTAYHGVWPYHYAGFENSHGSNLTAVMAGLCGVLAGNEAAMAGISNLPANVARWLEVGRMVLASYSPYIGAYGLHSFGERYGSYWELHLDALDQIAGAAGVDVWGSPRLQAVGKNTFIAYPPRVTGGGFGDEATAAYSMGYALSFAAKVPSSDASHAMLVAGTTETDIGLVSGRGWRNQKVPTPGSVGAQRLAIFDPRAGLAFMHSSLLDMGRTTVGFRCSPMGSANHHHADHTSFYIMSKGVHLVLDAGWYDGYHSAHTEAVSRRDNSHNTLMSNGRTGGQRLAFTAPGMTDAWLERTDAEMIGWHDERAYCWVSGDARNAYDQPTYARSKANRCLVYFRELGVLIVIDDAALVSGAFTWEWQFHSRFIPTGTGPWAIADGAASCTLTSLYASAGAAVATLDTPAAFSTPPAATADTSTGLGGTWNDANHFQSHSYLTYPAATTLLCAHMWIINPPTPVSAATASVGGGGLLVSFAARGKTWSIDYNTTTGVPTVT